MNAYPIAAQASDDMALQVPDLLLVPSLLQALFWKPRFMVDSPVTVHVPLFYWLSCVLRPQRVSVLGAHDGMAHFAFCQALDRLGTNGRCEAFGFWPDAKAGEGVALPPVHLREHQEMLYDGLSELIPCASLDEAFDQMKPETVDLLFCDLTALPVETRISCGTLLGCLSKSGILLLHGTKKAKQGKANLRDLSGFLDSRCYVDFPEGDGLTLMCSGGDLPAPLQSMLDMAPGGILRRDVEQVFRHSGQGLRAIASRAAHAQALQRAEGTAIEAQETLRQTRHELLALQDSHDLHSTSLAKMQCEAFDLRRELEELTSIVATSTIERNTANLDVDSARQAQANVTALLAAAKTEAAAARNGLEAERTVRFQETEALVQMSEELRNRLETTEAALVERTKERDAACSEAKAAQKAQEKAAADQARAEAALTSAQANAEAAKAELQAERHTRFEETAALTRITEGLYKKIQADAEAAKAQLQIEHQDKLRGYELLNKVAEDLRKNLKEISKQKEWLQRHNQELLDSTSWRITSPMRAVKTKLEYFTSRARK